MKISRSVCLPVVVILFSNISSAQNFNFKKDHDALQVKNLSVAADFYKNILNLKEIPNGGLGEHIRWFQLNNGVQVHLIESEDEIEKHKGVHMAINTDRLEEFMEFLKAKNIPFENWPGDKNTTNTRPDGVKQIYFQDPDGYWIEVNDGKV